MEVMYFFKHVPESVQAPIQDYFGKKLPRIEKLLTHYPPDGVLLHVNVEQFSKNSACRVEFVLFIPHQQLVAAETSHLYTKAIDDAKDKLIFQLKDIKERFIDKDKRRKYRRRNTT